jgi:hypothetical protein
MEDEKISRIGSETVVQLLAKFLVILWMMVQVGYDPVEEERKSDLSRCIDRGIRP